MSHMWAAGAYACASLTVNQSKKFDTVGEEIRREFNHEAPIEQESNNSVPKSGANTSTIYSLLFRVFTAVRWRLKMHSLRFHHIEQPVSEHDVVES
jgi:hypothetical protein